ncbi:MAG: PilZ domain-containing protein [Candidatus Aminicenantales bacterium]
MAKRFSVNPLNKIGGKEQGFSFPLSTVVHGLNARGKEFSEETVLSYISHQGSSFSLKNPVTIGTRVKLIIDLPEKLSENKNLKLVVKGTVESVDVHNPQRFFHQVSIRFDSKYIIKHED